MAVSEEVEQNRRSNPELNEEDREFVHGTPASYSSRFDRPSKWDIWGKRVIDGLILLGLIYALLNH